MVYPGAMQERIAEKLHQLVLGTARGLFMNRLHVLRLTEIVRNGIRPNEDGIMLLPPELDDEMKKQAFDYVLTCFPEEYHLDLLQQRQTWLAPQ